MPHKVKKMYLPGQCPTIFSLYIVIYSVYSLKSCLYDVYPIKTYIASSLPLIVYPIRPLIVTWYYNVVRIPFPMNEYLVNQKLFYDFKLSLRWHLWFPCFRHRHSQPLKCLSRLQ